MYFLKQFLFLTIIFIISGCENENKSIEKKEEKSNIIMSESISKLHIRRGNPPLFFFYDLLERVWITEFNNGVPVDGVISISTFCFKDSDQKPLIHNKWAGKTVQFEKISIQDKNQTYEYWPYNCRPIIPVTNPYNINASEMKEIVFKMLDFDGVEEVLPNLVEILLTNELGRYRIHYENAKAMYIKIFEAKKENKKHFVPEKKMMVKHLSTYQYIDEFPWKDTPNVLPGSLTDFRKGVRKRFLDTDLVKKEYKFEKANGLVTVRIKWEVN